MRGRREQCEVSTMCGKGSDLFETKSCSIQSLSTASARLVIMTFLCSSSSVLIPISSRDSLAISSSRRRLYPILWSSNARTQKSLVLRLTRSFPSTCIKCEASISFSLHGTLDECQGQVSVMYVARGQVDRRLSNAEWQRSRYSPNLISASISFRPYKSLMGGREYATCLTSCELKTGNDAPNSTKKYIQLFAQILE